MGQPKLSVDLKKPKEFENRQLGSEKMANKKFTIVRRFFQNTYTHYNYYYNANNLLNQIVDRAQQGRTEDYTELLPFYPWSLEQTSQSKDIDSVLQKCTAGILLHDLRNDWIDNMYLLMGRAYYLRRDFDSAAMAFQFLNYTYAPKAKDGSDIPIGSNAKEGGNSFSVVNKEKKTPVLRRPPSRNDAFIWQVRNYTDKGDYLEAASLVSVLRNDPLFPKRLEGMLYESIAYLHYKQQIWDTAAVYLEKSVDEAIDGQDKARRWYLAAQMYQQAGMNQQAAEAYAKSTGMAIDPVMELYARLNSIRLRKTDDSRLIDNNVADLVTMARRDKYFNYRDIIYYAAALYELERDGYAAAENFLQKSIATNTTNSRQRSMSFFQLAEVRYAQKKYGQAASPYDSLQLNALKPQFAALVDARKPGCKDIFKAETAISLQDSLLALANMDEAERTAFVKALSKKLRKERGIKEEEPSEGSMAGSGTKTPTDQPANLFANASGTWYFYEPTIRSNGYLSFRERWGARPNMDNWRRSSALGLSASKMPLIDIENDPDGGTFIVGKNEDELYDTTDVSFDNLYSRIPISEEKKLAAGQKIITNLYDKAAALHIKLEDYPEAIKVYEEILRRTDTGTIAINSLKGLVHCYYKTGDRVLSKQTSDKLQKLLGAEATASKPAQSAEQQKIINATYQKVYDLFIEGRFGEAIAARAKADSTLGKSYWTPQLLYIQSVYHIKQVEDSLALKELSNITGNFAGHKLADRAKVLSDVLKRRKQIEDYLTKLQVKRMEDDETSMLPIAVAYAGPKDDQPKLTKEEKEAAEKALLEKLEAERLAGLKAQKEQEEAARLSDAKRQEQELAKAAQLKAEQEAAEKALAEKKEAERLAAEKALAEKQEAERLAAEKALAEKLEAERLAAEKALAEKLEAERLAAEKEAAEKAAAEKKAAEEALAKKLAEEKAAEEKALAEKQRLEKEAEEKAMAEKQAAEKARIEKELADKQAKEKAELEKLTADKEEAARQLALKQAAEKEAMEKEMLARQAAEKEAAEKLLAEKQAAEKAEELKKQQEKEAAEKLKAEKELAEKQAADKAAADKAMAEKLAAEKAAAEKLAAEKAAQEKLAMEQALAEKAAKEKAEAERLQKEREAAERLAAEKLKAQKEAEEKAALAKTSMIDNVLVTQPTTASPFSIKANEPQVVAIVLERIDPAYVNEVSYGLGNSPLKNKDDIVVDVVKKKLRDNLWLVELQSPKFTNMQQAYDYIKYIRPIAQNELLTWLDASKYYFITISQANLKVMESTQDASLYYKILKEAIPNKF